MRDGLGKLIARVLWVGDGEEPNIVGRLENEKTDLDPSEAERPSYQSITMIN